MAAKKPAYDPLSEDEAETPAAGGDPNDPFADPTDFLGSIGGSSGSKSRGKERMECKLFTKSSRLESCQLNSSRFDTGAAI